VARGCLRFLTATAPVDKLKFRLNDLFLVVVFVFLQKDTLYIGDSIDDK
jgi:hypothetical protein